MRNNLILSMLAALILLATAPASAQQMEDKVVLRGKEYSFPSPRQLEGWRKKICPSAADEAECTLRFADLQLLFAEIKLRAAIAEAHFKTGEVEKGVAAIEEANRLMGEAAVKIRALMGKS